MHFMKISNIIFNKVLEIRFLSLSVFVSQTISQKYGSTSIYINYLQYNKELIMCHMFLYERSMSLFYPSGNRTYSGNCRTCPIITLLVTCIFLKGRGKTKTIFKSNFRQNICCGQKIL